MSLDVTHLVDPEFAPLLELLPPGGFDFTDVVAARELRERLAPPAPIPSGVAWEDRALPGPEGSPDVTVRIFRPEGVAGPLPTIVWIHGGGYLVGTYEADNTRLSDWVLALGCAAVSVEYRLAPEHPYPAPLEDCYAALAGVHADAAHLGLDPDRLLVAGASAGGGLCAGLALLARDRDEVPVTHQVLVYPMIDDRGITRSSRWDAPVWNDRNNETGWRGYLGERYGTDDVPGYAAPARAADLAGLPPTLLVVGGADLFVDEDIEYARRLGEAHVPVELHVYPGAVHGFDDPLIGGEATVARQCRRDVADYLRRAVRSPGS